MTKPEPRNAFYLILLASSFLFVVTALAYALIPSLEQQAIDAGQPRPVSPLSDALRVDGWKWLLYEVGAITISGILSMVLDRLRSLQKEKACAIIPSSLKTEH